MKKLNLTQSKDEFMASIILPAHRATLVLAQSHFKHS